MLLATCHCGAVNQCPFKAGVLDRLQLFDLPAQWGALGLIQSDTATLGGHPENTTQYIWGARTIRTMHCKIYGCATHWEFIDSVTGTMVGVNARNFETQQIDGIKIRKFDGADTWDYID